MTNPRRDYEDRLIETALREKFGGARPPDLSERVLAALAGNDVKPAAAAKERRFTLRAVALIAVSACLLLAVALGSWELSPEQVVHEERAVGDVAINWAGSHQALPPNYRTSLEVELAALTRHAAAVDAERRRRSESPQLLVTPRIAHIAEAEAQSAYQVPVEENAAARYDAHVSERYAETDLPQVQAVVSQAALADQAKFDALGKAYKSERPQFNAERAEMLRHKILNLRQDRGQGPGEGGDQYARIVENPFLRTLESPLSTFSIDVDTASYAKVRMYLLQQGMLPPPDAVRIEELVNYFDYDYDGPEDEHPFAAHLEAAECPWNPTHRLVRIALKGREIEKERPGSNLVFLLDVSGSMDQPNKLPLVKAGMKMLVRQLSENDRVAIVVYAGAAGLVLSSTPGSEQATILEAIDRLHAGGSTNGGEGIRLAYQTALDHFLEGGVNRVILCTDGDFNVGVTSTGELTRLAEEQAKAGVFLSVLGFGMGNHNDAMLEELSGKANGNYAFIDTESEARKVLVEQMAGTLVTIAKDVKIQVEFNPAEVAAYRLLGYENRILAAEDFNDDKKDAGEIGAGHTVTALYEIVPAKASGGREPPDDAALPASPAVDDLKYQSERKLTKNADSGELLTLKLRYKKPDADTSTLMTRPLADAGGRFSAASRDFQFAAAVAAFGMILRGSQHHGTATLDVVEEIAASAKEPDRFGYRAEFLELVKAARRLRGG
ncbi:MAG: VWA domain-containing protein [Planctomycetes bacterium]|nr:VWA domain-containing protein [Planctomycetota bacterium]